MKAGGIQPVRRLKVADSVAAELEQLIAAAHYKVGEKLPPERDLAAMFAVGRSSMREALRIVEAGGLVRTDHGIGVFVVSNTRRAGGLTDLLVYGDFTIFDLFEVRLLLEPHAAALAARRITPALAAELDALIVKASDLSIGDDEFIRLDAQLHRTIAKAAKNPLLLALAESIGPLFTTYSHRVIELPGRRAIAHAGHAKIVKSIVGRETREARSAAVRHIRDVERDVAERIDEVVHPG
jgi:GntR family transcriptional regulator, transcriptional repressor for pyruvate dehydrogenase complex